MNTILIFGISGQDGYNLAYYLIKNFNNNIKIIGCYNNNKNIEKILLLSNNINLIKFDLRNLNQIDEIIMNTNPDIIFNFAAIQPQFTNNIIDFFNFNTLSTIQILESICKYNKNIRYFSAGSSLEYKNENKIIDLDDKTEPDNAYGISKLSNRLLINLYREKFNLFVVHGILFNHDSASRSDDFLSKKIINHLINIKKSIENNSTFTSMEINNVFTYRDWSDSRDFIEAIWLIMNINESDNYILSSGNEYSIYDFINICLEILDYKNYLWTYDNQNIFSLYYNNHILIKSLSTNIIKNNIGNNKKILDKIDWKPKISFKKMIEDMIYNIYF